MRVKKIQINSNNPSFGTRLGANLREKIYVAQKNHIINVKHLQVISKIQDDGLDVVLDISDKYVIKRSAEQSILQRNKRLTISDEQNNDIVIDNLEKVYRPTDDNQQFYFSLKNLAELFNDDYNLAEKIRNGYNKLKTM